MYLDQSLVPSIYTDGTYAASNPGWHTRNSPWKAAQILKAIRRLPQSPATIAEIGCGPGAILSALADHLDADLFGFDISPHAIAMAKPKDRVHLTVGSIPEMGKYDLVLCIDVMEHVEDLFGFLRSLRAKGEAFAFHIPLDLNCYGLLRHCPLGNRKALGHLHYFDRHTALATLSDCGFNVRNWFFTRTIDTYNAPVKGILKSFLFNINQDLAAILVTGFSLMVTAVPAD